MEIEEGEACFRSSLEVPVPYYYCSLWSKIVWNQSYSNWCEISYRTLVDPKIIADADLSIERVHYDAVALLL